MTVEEVAPTCHDGKPKNVSLQEKAAKSEILTEVIATKKTSFESKGLTECLKLIQKLAFAKQTRPNSSPIHTGEA